MAQLKEMMEGFQKDCPSYDEASLRKRNQLHGMGIKTTGFVGSVFEIAKSNPDFAPHFMDVTLLDEKLRKMENITSLRNILKQFMELVETDYLFKSNECYHLALGYYDSLKEYARQGSDSVAEMLFKKLKPFFKNRGKRHSPGETAKPD
jgi:hypothetical protein